MLLLVLAGPALDLGQAGQNDHGPGPGGHLVGVPGVVVGVPGQDEDEIVGPVVKDEIEKVKLSGLS